MPRLTPAQRNNAIGQLYKLWHDTLASPDTPSLLYGHSGFPDILYHVYQGRKAILNLKHIQHIFIYGYIVSDTW